MPSTACTLPSSLAKWVLSSGFRAARVRRPAFCLNRSRIDLQHLHDFPGIECVAQSVAEEIEREHGEEIAAPENNAQCGAMSR